MAWDVRGLLDEPGLCASVATTGTRGSPLLGVHWFVYREGRFWFTSQKIHTLARAAERGVLCAVLVQVFDPPRIEMVRTTGPAQVEVWNAEIVQSMYVRYLGDDLEAWPDGTWRPRLADGLEGTYRLWSVRAERGVAVSFPAFGEGESSRWENDANRPF